jgi:hypothetical protein
MRASERRHHRRAVRNSPFTGAILAKAAFFKTDEKNSDTRGRDIDIQLFASPSPALRKQARLLL